MKYHFPRLIIYIVALCLVSFTFSGCKRNKTFTVKAEAIKVDSLSQIVLLDNKLVKPLLYSNISGLSRLPVPEAKKKFISAVLPAILVAKHEIGTLKIKLNALKEKGRWNKKDSAFYVDITSRFKAKGMEDLTIKMGTLPNSIVLAQAAVESGWGQSRFFLQGNNLFGIWSFNANEPRMQAGLTREGKHVYVRSYENISQSVMHYFEVLGSSRAYRSLLKARQETDDPFKLLPHLKNFSERRTSYTNQLKEVVLQNKLTLYDLYELDPEYLEED